MRAPIRLVRGGWPDRVTKRLGRFVRQDLRILARPDVPPEEFREAMSHVYVGQTIKITGSNRHPGADQLLIDNVDTAGKIIVDIGASDASTSLDLIRKLDEFDSFVVADLFLSVEALEHGRRLFLYDRDGSCILIAGPRFVAWPAQSAAVRLLYRGLLSRAERRRAERTQLMLLNPEFRQLMADDPRVSYRIHDVFDVWPDHTVDVVKVANLLRRLYFSDEQILRALGALHASISDGGHLLIVDNPRIAGIDHRGGLYRREPEGFSTVAETAQRPEIADLVTALRCE